MRSGQAPAALSGFRFLVLQPVQNAACGKMDLPRSLPFRSLGSHSTRAMRAAVTTRHISSHLINTRLGIGGAFPKERGTLETQKHAVLGNHAERPMNHLPIYEMASSEPAYR
jgi:hypothetical protein